MKRTSRLLTLVCVAGCGVSPSGEDSKSGSAAPPHAETQRASGMTVAADADLPECTENQEGMFVYVTAGQTFKVCSAGTWLPLDLKGPKGDKGDPGQDGSDGSDGSEGADGTDGTDGGDAGIGATSTESTFEKGLKHYQKYRRSVFRATLTCQLEASPAPTCPSAGSKTFFGSGFLCGTGQVCTNVHVVSCPTCYEFASLGFQALEGASDTLNSDGTPATPFYTANSNAAFILHPTRDLAVIPATGIPSGLAPIPLAATAAVNVQPLTPVLSLSFPLGFVDLYVDMGYVNTGSIGECDHEGGQSGYGCPKSYLAFSTTNDTDHGSSGSPLIDVNSGQVIGLTTAGTEDENANFTWASDASLLRPMLE